MTIDISEEKHVGLFVFIRCTCDEYGDMHDDVWFGACLAVEKQQI